MGPCQVWWPPFLSRNIRDWPIHCWLSWASSHCRNCEQLVPSVPQLPSFQNNTNKIADVMGLRQTLMLPVQNPEHERRRNNSLKQNPRMNYGLTTVSLVTFMYVSCMCPWINLTKLFIAFYIQLPPCWYLQIAHPGPSPSSDKGDLQRPPCYLGSGVSWQMTWPSWVENHPWWDWYTVCTSTLNSCPALWLTAQQNLASTAIPWPPSVQTGTPLPAMDRWWF